MLLTEAERERFAGWLLMDAKSNVSLLEQLDKMFPPLAEQKRKLIAAELLVARELL